MKSFEIIQPARQDLAFCTESFFIDWSSLYIVQLFSASMIAYSIQMKPGISNNVLKLYVYVSFKSKCAHFFKYLRQKRIYGIGDILFYFLGRLTHDFGDLLLCHNKSNIFFSLVFSPPYKYYLVGVQCI